jgi:hypothetical protein
MVSGSGISLAREDGPVLLTDLQLALRRRIAEPLLAKALGRPVRAVPAGAL